MDLGIHSLAVFMISGLLLNITPGPDSLLIMTRSASQGWQRCLNSAIGLGFIGLSLKLAQSQRQV